MITAVEIRKKTERKYVDYLRSVVAGSEFEPIVIPCDKKARDRKSTRLNSSHSH